MALSVEDYRDAVGEAARALFHRDGVFEGHWDGQSDAVQADYWAQAVDMVDTFAPVLLTGVSHALAATFGADDRAAIFVADLALPSPTSSHNAS